MSQKAWTALLNHLKKEGAQVINPLPVIAYFSNDALVPLPNCTSASLVTSVNFNKRHFPALFASQSPRPSRY
jgi:hypothetical protein